MKIKKVHKLGIVSNYQSILPKGKGYSNNLQNAAQEQHN